MDTIYCIVSLVYLISSVNPQNLYRKWCETSPHLRHKVGDVTRKPHTRILSGLRVTNNKTGTDFRIRNVNICAVHVFQH